MKKRTEFQKEKRCNKCGLVKPAKDFSKHGKLHSFSLKYACKKCQVERMKKWIEKNREKFNKYQKDYQYKRNHNG